MHRWLVILPAFVLVACEGHDESPTIAEVAWTHASGCEEGTATDVTVTVSAVDHHTSIDDLIFFGSVDGCTGSLDMPTSMVNCPNDGPTDGTVAVLNEFSLTAEASFTIEPCVAGSVSPSAD
jgi:hypothetical protein